MRILTPSTEDLRARFDGDDEITEIGDTSIHIVDRLAELRHLAPGVEVTLMRDWEGCPCAIVEGDERFDSLAFTEDGRVGHGGVNQPEYHGSIEELIA